MDDAVSFELFLEVEAIGVGLAGDCWGSGVDVGDYIFKKIRFLCGQWLSWNFSWFLRVPFSIQSPLWSGYA